MFVKSGLFLPEIPVERLLRVIAEGLLWLERSRGHFSDQESARKRLCGDEYVSTTTPGALDVAYLCTLWEQKHAPPTKMNC